MIDPASVNAALSSVVCFVVDKAFEHIVNGLAHYGLTTLQFAVWVAARISRESVNKAIDAMLIIFSIVWY